MASYAMPNGGLRLGSIQNKFAGMLSGGGGRGKGYGGDNDKTGEGIDMTAGVGGGDRAEGLTSTCRERRG